MIHSSEVFVILASDAHFPCWNFHHVERHRFESEADQPKSMAIKQQARTSIHSTATHGMSDEGEQRTGPYH